MPFASEHMTSMPSRTNVCSGFTPHRSRHTTNSRVRMSPYTNAHMPLNRPMHEGPQCIKACNRTSVSELVRNDTPSRSSSARNSR